jgi:hypothetical protein
MSGWDLCCVRHLRGEIHKIFELWLASATSYTWCRSRGSIMGAMGALVETTGSHDPSG